MGCGAAVRRGGWICERQYPFHSDSYAASAERAAGAGYPSNHTVHGISGLSDQKRGQRYEAGHSENSGSYGRHTDSPGGASAGTAADHGDQGAGFNLSVDPVHNPCKQRAGV